MKSYVLIIVDFNALSMNFLMKKIQNYVLIIQNFIYFTGECSKMNSYYLLITFLYPLKKYN